MEALAAAVGQVSRRDAIIAVGRDLHCDAGSAGVDSAAVQACGGLTSADAARLIAAFARGVGRPLLDQWPSTNADYPACDGETVARIGAPVVGDREGRWEGRITVEVSCRQPPSSTKPLRIVAKEYLFQWDGRAWAFYQVGTRRIAG
jgi:hypothetical protein